MAGAGFHDASMIAGVGVDQESLGLHSGQHLFEVGVKQLGIEFEFSGVALR